MRGFPPQTAEEREAAIDRLEDEARDAELLKSVIEKVARKYERLAPWARAKHDTPILMKLTTGELRVLRQFNRKFYEEPS
jgi:hypothetical protein